MNVYKNPTYFSRCSVSQPIRLPFMQMYLITNIAAYSANKPLVHFFTQPFWSYIIALGGGGATLGLCILLVKSKSVELRTLGKISIGPAIFNINEPIIFGLPMVLNPIMMIPFIFVPVVNSIIAYTCMALHIVGKGVIETPWTTPAPLGAALGCTEPVCVALCAAYASKQLNNPINKIELDVNKGIYKNGMSAGIPHCEHVGLEYAVSIGTLLKNPEKQLTLFEDIEPDTITYAELLVPHVFIHLMIQ